MNEKPFGNIIEFNIPTPWMGNSHRLPVKLFSIGLVGSILIMDQLFGITGMLGVADARTQSYSFNKELKLPALKDSIKFQKKQPKNAFQAGEQAYLTGDYQEAVDNFLLAAAKNPYNPNITYFLADCYVKLNQYDLAKVYYHKTLFINPTSSAGTLALMALEAIDSYNLKYSPFYPLPNDSSPSFIESSGPSDESETLSSPGGGKPSANTFKLNANPFPPEPLHS
ncbi:MAG: tetratricopeptide repeat protein, partial [Cyanobacteria bacterium]|nr:tetratricopeptide repeat protein [Cyanobacteriota bacterium]